MYAVVASVMHPLRMQSAHNCRHVLLSLNNVQYKQRERVFTEDPFAGPRHPPGLYAHFVLLPPAITGLHIFMPQVVHLDFLWRPGEGYPQRHSISVLLAPIYDGDPNTLLACFGDMQGRGRVKVFWRAFDRGDPRRKSLPREFRRGGGDAHRDATTHIPREQVQRPVDRLPEQASRAANDSGFEMIAILLRGRSPGD